MFAKGASTLLRLSVSAYAKSTNGFFGNDVVMSETGRQQYGPLGPVLFAFFIDDIAR